MKNRKDLIKELLNYEDVKFVKDIAGNTPLTYALYFKNFEIINQLLEYIHDKPDLISLITPIELS
jgi:ankyrin repeat protein